MIHWTKNRSFAIDLGNNNTKLIDKEKVLLAQPSYIVFDSGNKSIKAVGDEALDMYEKSHDQLKPVKPLRGGMIADYESASAMIKQMVFKTYQSRNLFSGFDQIISGVPFSSTEVERRALRDAIDELHPRRRFLLYEPIAAALGMGMNIAEPEGKMIIDIGGGITEVVIISLSGIVTSKSVKIGGDSFDLAIQDYFRNAFGMIIGNHTAEQVKQSVGALTQELFPEPVAIKVKGKDIKQGIPVSRDVSYQQIGPVISKSFEAIESCALHVLESCPPELAGDIYKNGVYITGGGALLKGIQQRLELTLRLPIHLAKDPLLSVSKGASMVLRNPEKFKGLLV